MPGAERVGAQQETEPDQAKQSGGLGNREHILNECAGADAPRVHPAQQRDHDDGERLLRSDAKLTLAHEIVLR